MTDFIRSIYNVKMTGDQERDAVILELLVTLYALYLKERAAH